MTLITTLSEKGFVICMYKIAVVGDKDSVAGFGALGLETYFVDGLADTKRVFKMLASGEEYAVIYITEKAAALIPDEIEKYNEQIIPAVIEIPGVSGNTGRGILGVKRSVEKAVGSDIIFKD